ncbi:hypothetical protein EVAR_12467_1 [Eumeta japonica]|uniref:Uncharacterized protein n=1 Tax=Eumeta variegata TaxID=151549 RepID=A0A4C1TPI0_EUMVA|nr:hypothetical protein EVAR_12467_1 [Eumeta japonica]
MVKKSSIIRFLSESPTQHDVLGTFKAKENTMSPCRGAFASDAVRQQNFPFYNECSCGDGGSSTDSNVFSGLALNSSMRPFEPRTRHVFGEAVNRIAPHRDQDREKDGFELEYVSETGTDSRVGIRSRSRTESRIK